MTSNISKGAKRFAACVLLLGCLLAGCEGGDYTPVYFPPSGGEDELQPTPSESTGGRECTLVFTSQLCVTIKGEKLDTSGNPEDNLCTEVPPFPMHVSGNTIRIDGSEFPDVVVENEKLPVPITINARGDGDGKSNVGEGTIDGAGNIKIDNFSLYIVALGIVGEVPNLTLTTGSTEEFPYLPAETGSPPDASGAMTLVTGTTLGSVIEAADEYLMGASLTAIFTGSISPALNACGNAPEASIEVTKLIIDDQGRQTESKIPDDNRMEISTGTYIAEGDLDIGERFESTAKFRVKNIGSKPQYYQIPPRKGPYHLSSVDSLTGTLAPQQSMILNATFRPTMSDAEPGEMVETLAIGTDQFFLVATALSRGGEGEVNVVDDEGDVTTPGVDRIDLGEAAVPAGTQRDFFNCKKISCGESEAWTACTECPDPSTTPCELLPVSTSGRPMGEVNEACEIVDPDAAPLLIIDLKGSGGAGLPAQKQVLAIRNRGVTDMRITGVAIEEAGDSRSKGQFDIPEGAIFLAKSFNDVRERVRNVLTGEGAQGISLPVTLPPFQSGYEETTLYVVVTYKPDDLIGADGDQAGVGSTVNDRARVRITTDDGDITTDVTGTTTIMETPPLELYFKTSTGTKHVADGRSFSFKGVTTNTVDVAVPVFLKTADTAASAIRITSISVTGEDANMFRWLDTAQKISAVQPDSGKGMRCSIFEVDETTSEVLSESFDLNPVSLDAPGFDMAPGAYSIDTMPLFGCIDFHRDEGSTFTKRTFEANLVIQAQDLTETGVPARNPDGSFRETKLTARLLATIDPRSGRLVLRITQTMAAVLNPQFPGLSAIAAKSEVAEDIAAGRLKETDLQVFTGALILDPFDEMPIKSLDGTEILTTPNDGITAVFRSVDTHPVSTNYDDDTLFDYASLTHDMDLAGESHGVFDDYPNVPAGAKANGWRIYTSTLSYPGPLAPPEDKPVHISDCLSVNPCSPEGLKLFTDAGVPPGEKGACAFFYATGGRYDSPAFHSAEEMPGGEYINLCKRIDEPQNLKDMNTGHYSVDGRLTVEEAGLRFFGPTYFHNPGGPLGPKPPMDTVFHLAFTSGPLIPQQSPDDPNTIPDEKISLAKGEYKINLDDATLPTVPICENNTKNRLVKGKYYSTWKYLEGLLFKDEEMTVPAGCPEDDNDYTGGSAYLRGRDIDHETGVFTIVTAAKFGSSDDLSFAFKDVMLFLVLNGWLCDPMGSEEDYEGSRCYDTAFNERDSWDQLTIMD